MSVTKSRTAFFKKIEHSYENAVCSIMELIEHGEHVHTSYLEVNFILKLIAKLRIDFRHNSIVTAEVFDEVLKGGHLKFEDKGSFYNELIKAFPSALKKRSSSHDSCTQQYSFSGPVVKEILFGISEDSKGNKTTWIQFERHNTNTLINLILHIFDYFIHKCTGKNVGPYGLSNHTESNPLMITPQ